MSTAICGIYATVALGDMVLYNRRRRNEFNATQRALYTTHIAEAREALAANRATPQQINLVEHEDGVLRAAQEKALQKGRGVFGRTKDWLLGGLSSDVVPGQQQRDEGQASYLLRNDNPGKEDQATKETAFPSPAPSPSPTSQPTVPNLRGHDSTTPNESGTGMLDRIGQESSRDVSSATNWLFGRGRNSKGSSSENPTAKR